MPTQSQFDELLLKKTEDLCQFIISHPQFSAIRQQIQAFMGDPKAQAQYRSLSEKGQALHRKQHSGETLNQTEIASFEKDREAFFANPVATGFVEAQEQMENVQETVSKYLAKTYELGRVPTDADFENEHECCGGHDHDEEHECCGGKNHEGEGEHEHGGEGCGCHKH